MSNQLLRGCRGAVLAENCPGCPWVGPLRLYYLKFQMWSGHYHLISAREPWGNLGPEIWGGMKGRTLIQGFPQGRWALRWHYVG